ncbi:MAG: hypothetical protein ACE5FO_08670 [Parvularculaceae bacterium]
MTRNWGLPSKRERAAVRSAREAKPLATLAISVVFGVFAAAAAALSFDAAQSLLAGVFHGWTMVAAVLAAGFGCWAYVWLARPRFAAHFDGRGDVFSDLLRFYARAVLALAVLLLFGRFSSAIVGDFISVLALCAAGGASAAAAFQTVLAFVPSYEEEETT